MSKQKETPPWTFIRSPDSDLMRRTSLHEPKEDGLSVSVLVEILEEDELLPDEKAGSFRLVTNRKEIYG